MANEAVKVELYGNNNAGDVRRYTVASGIAVPKGSLMALSDPRTASLATVQNSALAGIASTEKDATDGSTSLGLWTNGIFEMVASGSITVGAPVVCASGSANEVQAGDASDKGAEILGYALETASDAETINVRVML